MNVLQRKMFANGNVATSNPVEGDPVNQNSNLIPIIESLISQGYNPAQIKNAYPAASYGLIEQIAQQMGGLINPGVENRPTRTAPQAVTESQVGQFLNQLPIDETIVTGSGQGLSFNQPDPTISDLSIPTGVTSSQEISAIAQQIQDLKSERERIATVPGFEKIGRTIRGSLGMDVLDDRRANILSQIDQQIASLSNQLQESMQQPIRTGEVSPSLDMKPQVLIPGLPSDQEITGSETVATVSESGLKPNQYRNSQGKILNIDPAKFANQLESEDSRIIGGLLLNPNVEYGSNLAAIVEKIARRRSSTLVPEEQIGIGQDIQGLNPADVLQSGAKFGVDVAKEGIESLFNIARAPFTDPTIAGFFSRDRAKELRESGAGDRVNLFETGLDEVNLNNPFTAGQALVTGGFDEYFKTGGERPETLDEIVAESSTGVADPIQKELDEAAQTSGKGTEVITDETKEGEGVDAGEPADSADVASATANKEGGAGIAQGDVEGDIGTSLDDDDAAATSVAIYNDPDVIRLMRNLAKGIAVKGNIGEGFEIGAAGAAAEREAEAVLDKDRQAKIDAENIKAFGPRKPETIKLVKDAKTNIVKQYNQYREADSTVRLAESVKDYIQNGDIQSMAARLGVAKDRLYTLAGLGPDVSEVDPRERAQIALTILRQKNIKQILNEGGKNISNVDRQVAKDIAGNLDDLDLTQTPGGLMIRMEETIRSASGKRNDARAIAIGEYDALQETSQDGLYASDLNLGQELIDFLAMSNPLTSSYSGSARPSGVPAGANIIDLRPSQ